MVNRYANLVGSNKIKDEWQKINDGFDKVQQDVDQLQADLAQEIADREAAVEYVDQRVDNIIVGGGPDKDPELVDIRTPDPSYTPLEPISTAGGMTRDMQEQMAKGIGVFSKYIYGTNARGVTAWTSGVDNIEKAGFYHITGNRSGLPVDEDGYVIHHMGSNPTSITSGLQLYVPYTQNRIFFRRHNPTQWLSWIELQNNLSYETGVWTPELRFGGMTTGITYAQRSGRYTRIGNLVRYQIRISLSSKGTATGAATIAGLPFVHLGSEPLASDAVGAFYYLNLPAGTTYVHTMAVANQAVIQLRAGGNNLAPNTLDNTNFTDNTIIIMQGSYMIGG